MLFSVKVWLCQIYHPFCFSCCSRTVEGTMFGSETFFIDDIDLLDLLLVFQLQLSALQHPWRFGFQPENGGSHRNGWVSERRNESFLLFLDFNLQTILHDRVATVLKGCPARPKQVQKQQKDAASLQFWPDQTFKLHKAPETGSVLL